MGSKNKPAPFDCVSAAAPDEPMFTLLGRDPFGASLVKLWATARDRYTVKPTSSEKINEANACAGDMLAWCAHEAKRKPADVLDHLPVDMLTSAIARRGYSLILSSPCNVTLNAPVISVDATIAGGAADEARPHPAVAGMQALDNDGKAIARVGEHNGGPYDTAAVKADSGPGDPAN